MPTKHRRIAVVVDPELDEALSSTAARFPGRSAAALVKELAMLGASSLAEGREASSKLERLLARPGVRPADGDLAEFLAARPDRTVASGSDPYAGTDALKEQREENVDPAG